MTFSFLPPFMLTGWRREDAGEAMTLTLLILALISLVQLRVALRLRRMQRQLNDWGCSLAMREREFRQLKQGFYTGLARSSERRGRKFVEQN